MGILAKMFFGVLLILASGYWIIKGPSLIIVLKNLFNLQIQPNTALADFLTVVNGALPPLIFLIGIFIVWLEWDEWKIERELARESKRRKRRKK